MTRVIDERLKFDHLPIISPEQREAIPAAIADIERTLVGATAEQILPVLGTIAAALPQRKAPEDADAMLRVYVAALNDIPADILNDAGMEAVKTLKFYPRVAELREIAWPLVLARRGMIRRLEMLATKFDHEYRPPIEDPVRPEDFAKLRRKIDRVLTRQGLTTRRKATA